MNKYLLTIIFTFLHSSAVFCCDIEFFTQTNSKFMRVGFSYVLGAPNPLEAPQEYPSENCPITHTPFKVEDWVHKDVTGGFFEDVVARYGYGWVFFDIPHQKELANDMLKYAFQSLVKNNDESFRSVCEPICLELYTEARNKVANIFHFQRSTDDPMSVRIDEVFNKDLAIHFVGSLFYAYGGTLECKGESFLHLPLWDGARDRPLGEKSTYREVYKKGYSCRIQLLRYDGGVRFFSGALNDAYCKISPHRTPDNKLHITGLATIYNHDGI